MPPAAPVENCVAGTPAQISSGNNPVYTVLSIQYCWLKIFTPADKSFLKFLITIKAKLYGKGITVENYLLTYVVFFLRIKTTLS